MAKSEYIGINNVARKVKGIYVGVNGVARKVTKGYIGVGGVARQFYSSGTPLSSLAIGSIIKLNENSVSQEYIVIHQGNPDTNKYDSSCTGTWLLRKNIISVAKYNYDKQSTQYTTKYYTSYFYTSAADVIITYFDQKVQDNIKLANVPAYASSHSPKKLFLLSANEVGFTSSDDRYVASDSAKLDYFESGSSDSAKAKRVADYCNGYPTGSDYWWLRSGCTLWSKVPSVNSTGACYMQYQDSYYGIRFAMIMNSNLLIDSQGNIIVS